MTAPQFFSSTPNRNASAPLPEVSASTRPRRFRPPVGIPTREERGPLGWIVSTLIHAILIALLLVPFMHDANDDPLALGAGGAGPRGGGGGGNRGTGGEHLTFVRVAPAPAPAADAIVAPVVPPPVAPPVPQPVIPPITPPPTPVAAQPVVAAAVPQVAAAPVPGTNGGTGSDGTAGNGPGTGGGIGSGTGTGTGSDAGPGTGGNGGLVSCGTPVNFYFPVDVWAKLKKVVIIADVNETGQTMSIEIHSGNRGLDNQVKQYARNWTFKPPTKADGTVTRARCSFNVN